VRCERIVRDLNLLFYAITLLPYVKRFNRFYQLFHIDHFFPQVLEVFRLVRGVAPARSARNGILKDIATILLENKTVSMLLCSHFKSAIFYNSFDCKENTTMRFTLRFANSSYGKALWLSLKVGEGKRLLDT
jgi:hypothetical protein